MISVIKNQNNNNKKNSRSLKKIQESTSVSLKKSQSTPEKHKLWLNEAMKTIHDLKIEFIKKKNIKETQAKSEDRIEKSKTQLEDSRESLISRIY